jgi:YVTN family beta-propeller protein
LLKGSSQETTFYGLPVANYDSNTTSVIDSSTNTVVGNISNIKVREFPSDVAVEPEVVVKEELYTIRSLANFKMQNRKEVKSLNLTK